LQLYVFENFLSPEECQSIIDMVDNTFEPSTGGAP
jgi:hypothetical protein